MLTSVIRTLTAYIVGAITAGLLLAHATLPEESAQAITAFLAIVLANGYYLLVSLLGRLPYKWIRWVRYLLIVPAEPTYGAGADLLWAFLRTLIPMLIGWLISLIPQTIFVIDSATQTTIVLAVITTTQGAYYVAIKWLETQAPWFSVLLGGKPGSSPTYQ